MDIVLKNFLKEIITALFGASLILIQSCREDIIDPNNSAGNINEPVVISSFNSFEFVLNADKISRHLSEPVHFNSINNEISIKIKNFKGGNVAVSVKNNNDAFPLFADYFDKYHRDTVKAVTQNLPENIVITFFNFSGYFKLEFYSTGNY